jgi:hypothetical protein
VLRSNTGRRVVSRRLHRLHHFHRFLRIFRHEGLCALRLLHAVHLIEALLDLGVEPCLFVDIGVHTAAYSWR